MSTTVPTFDPTSLVQKCEGKTKVVYEIPDAPSLVLIRSKDRVTAFNAGRSHDVDGKASLSNITTCRVFKFLQQIGLKTHFVKQHSDTEMIAEHCAMIPLEWIIRRVATGSFLKRNPGVQEGYRFSPPKVEITLKDDAQGDPIWSEEMVVEAGITASGEKIEQRHVNLMKLVSTTVFETLERAWAQAGCTLVDMKIEFGVNVEGDIILADVIDNDSWRLWPAGDKRKQVDKQFYRDLPEHEITAEKLKEMKKNFSWVTEQLKKFTCSPKGRCVVLLGSGSDIKGHGDKIVDELYKLAIPAFLRVSSAHKATNETMQIIRDYEGDEIPTVFICGAGRSNGLGPVTAGNTVYPVINCPPVSAEWGAQDIWSSIRLPSGLGCSTVLDPASAALAAAKILALFDHNVWCKLRVKQLINHIQLMVVDQKCLHDSVAHTERLHRAMSRDLLNAK